MTRESRSTSNPDAVEKRSEVLNPVVMQRLGSSERDIQAAREKPKRVSGLTFLTPADAFIDASDGEGAADAAPAVPPSSPTSAPQFETKPRRLMRVSTAASGLKAGLERQPSLKRQSSPQRRQQHEQQHEHQHQHQHSHHCQPAKPPAPKVVCAERLHEGTVRCCAYSRDGRFLAVGDYANWLSVYLVAPSSARPAPAPDGRASAAPAPAPPAPYTALVHRAKHEGEVRCCTFSTLGSELYLVAGDYACKLTVLRLLEGVQAEAAHAQAFFQRHGHEAASPTPAAAHAAPTAPTARAPASAAGCGDGRGSSSGGSVAGAGVGGGSIPHLFFARVRVLLLGGGLLCCAYSMAGTHLAVGDASQPRGKLTVYR